MRFYVERIRGDLLPNDLFLIEYYFSYLYKYRHNPYYQNRKVH